MPNRAGHSKYVAGEMCQTFNSHWGIGGKDFAYMAPSDVIQNLAACRKVGANYLLNVGPTAGGGFPAYEKANLERVGDWVRLHAEAIYDARPCEVKASGRDFVLQNGDALFYFAHDLARVGEAQVTTSGGGVGPRALAGLQAPIENAMWLDSAQELKWAQNAEAGIVALDLTGYPYGSDLVVRIAKIELKA